MRSLLPIILILTLLSCVRKEEEIVYISENGETCKHIYTAGDYTKHVCTHDSDRVTINYYIDAVKRRDSLIEDQSEIIDRLANVEDIRRSQIKLYELQKSIMKSQCHEK